MSYCLRRFKTRIDDNAPKDHYTTWCGKHVLYSRIVGSAKQADKKGLPVCLECQFKRSYKPKMPLYTRARQLYAKQKTV